jgi:pyridoxal phosphate enzyme (YggS family)
VSDAGAVAGRLAAVRERVAAAAQRAGRPPQSVTLLGVAKRIGAEAVAEAVRAGLLDVGENYAQEAREKLPAVCRLLEGDGLPPPRWHFIGQIQRNKAGLLASRFDWVQTVDREAVGAALDRRAAAAGRALDVLLQIDLSGEPGKGGCDPEDAAALLAASRAWEALRVRGLMAIPAPTATAEASRPAFAALRRLRDALRGEPGGAQLTELSMGMSRDFEVAIEEGATIVRVGTAIFGAR